MLTEKEQRKYLVRIESALRAAAAVALQHALGTFDLHDSAGSEVATEVDRHLSGLLRQSLLGPGEEWPCKEDADAGGRNLWPDLTRVVCRK